MVTTSPTTTTDNINNFTAAGKAQQKTDAEKGGEQLFSNYQDFIKLLTVQLQNQDPTKPMETDQITSQLAQLSTVEQGVNTNKNLEKMMALFTQNQVTQNVGYIGKLVEAPGNLGSLLGGKGIFVYNLEAEAATADVTISDPDGNVVYQTTGTKLAGRNTFVWDGKKNDGTKAADGTYQISVKAKDPGGEAIASATSSSGKVTSVETIDGTTYIALGDILVPMDKVVSVREMPTLG